MKNDCVKGGGRMKRMKGATCILLVIILLVGMMGCTRGENVTPDVTTGSTTAAVTTTKQVTQGVTTTQAVTTEVENFLAEHLEISWIVGDCLQYEEGRWDELELEERFNVDLKVWNIDNRDVEQITMMLAAGDFPNFAALQYWNTNLLWESKLIRTVKKDMIVQNIPTLARYMDEEPFSWDMGKVPETEDEYFGILRTTPQDTFPWMHTTFRLDWLENLGYEFDDITPIDSKGQIFITNRQFSFEELNELYEAFTLDDPDGNGEDDTYARLYNDSAESEGDITGMWNYIPHNKYIYKDPSTGDYVDFRGYSGMRDFWEWITDQLDKGYVHQAPSTENITLLALPNVGNLQINAFALCSAKDAHQVNPPNILLRDNPDVKLIITPPPQGPDGIGNMYIRQFTKWNGVLCYIGEETTDTQLARLLQILEYTCFGDQVMRYTKGIEGVHYTWESEPQKSRLIMTDPAKVPVKYAGAGSAFTNIFNTGVFATTMYTYLGLGFTWENHVLEEYWRANEWFEQYGMVPAKNTDWTRIGLDMQERYNEINKEVSGSVNTVYNDFKKRVFEGQVGDMRTEWSQYINALYAAGYQKIVDLYNDDTWPMTTELYKGSRWVK